MANGLNIKELTKDILVDFKEPEFSLINTILDAMEYCGPLTKRGSKEPGIDTKYIYGFDHAKARIALQAIFKSYNIKKEN